MTREIAALLLGLLLPLSARADTVQVAVASNFGGAMKEIAKSFQKDTGHEVTIMAAGTGKLYAQIKNGAPFEVLLSADDKTPKNLEAEGLAVPGTRFTYALGKLVLWSARSNTVDREGNVLRQGHFAHISLGNPKTVPYGQAAVEVLRHLGLYETLEPRFVLGENVAHAQQFVDSGNAELGFIAKSGVYKDGRLISGSAWWIPDSLYSPIRQDAVLLKQGEQNAAARALLAYLRQPPARAIMTALGYGFE